VTGTPEAFVLDTSAILALWNEEDGASIVEKIHRDKPQQRKIYISFMTFME
jgi:PIN domain nuclease of toxin-antitoxin system